MLSDARTAVNTRCQFNKGDLAKIVNSLLSTSNKFSKVEGKWIKTENGVKAILGEKRERMSEETQTSAKGIDIFDIRFAELEKKMKKSRVGKKGSTKEDLNDITEMAKELQNLAKQEKKSNQIEKKICKLEEWVEKAEV